MRPDSVPDLGAIQNIYFLTYLLTYLLTYKKKVRLAISATTGLLVFVRLKSVTVGLCE